MANRGRPPIPNEIKKRRGTLRKDRVKSAIVHVLPQANETPKPPADLGVEGQALWSNIWAQAISWVSPDSDWAQTVEACRLADDLSIARRRFQATTDPADLRAVTTASKALTEALSTLGFNPTARSKLGLAEVKKVDALEAILQRRTRAKKAN